MNVKIFREDNIHLLEEKVNSFLNKDIQVIDIKYSTFSRNIYEYYSAMIIYEENK